MLQICFLAKLEVAQHKLVLLMALVTYKILLKTYQKYIFYHT